MASRGRAGHGSRLRRRPGVSRRRIPRWTPGGYCFDEWATVWDHMMPASNGGKTQPDNLMPCCRGCNYWFSDKIFPSIEAKREARRDFLREMERRLGEESERTKRGGSL